MSELFRNYSDIKFYIVVCDPVREVYKLKDIFPENIIVTGTVKDEE
jgi:hypothetical protein